MPKVRADATSGCHEWHLADKTGYGLCSVNRETRLAHHVASLNARSEVRFRSGNFGERQVRLIDHALGSLHTGGFCDLRRMCSKMLLKQSAQMARANPKMLRQRFDPALIEGTLIDQARRALDCSA
jgi:hypothetical protein